MSSGQCPEVESHQDDQAQTFYDVCRAYERQQVYDEKATDGGEFGGCVAPLVWRDWTLKGPGVVRCAHAGFNLSSKPRFASLFSGFFEHALRRFVP